ncbi:hypothetical protein HZS_6154 [Henneguya salminicola]|nr:hypothetical protein HZS_6154 [Henneguya salminicola]
MKECEIYSERIAIRVRGEIRYGLEYELKLKISPKTNEEIQNLIKATFSNCKIHVLVKCVPF